MQVKVKKLVENAVVPAYGKPGDAGMDLTATSMSFDTDGNVVYGVGLAFEIPEGYVGLLFPRSSNAKKGLALTNSVGVIDSGYRGEVMFKFKPTVKFYDFNPDSASHNEYSKVQGINAYNVDAYAIGDRIGQIIIMPYPQVTFEEVSELSDTERGEGGYGSTGK
jgi:dUTP pyrophosphatase